MTASSFNSFALMLIEVFRACAFAFACHVQLGQMSHHSPVQFHLHLWKTQVWTGKSDRASIDNRGTPYKHLRLLIAKPSELCLSHDAYVHIQVHISRSAKISCPLQCTEHTKGSPSVRRLGRLRSIEGLPSITPHGKVETPHIVHFSFLFFTKGSGVSSEAAISRDLLFTAVHRAYQKIRGGL